MAVNELTSWYNGPVMTTSRYVSYTMPSLPANQSYTLFWKVRFVDAFASSTDYSANTTSTARPRFWGNSLSGGTGGNDFYCWLYGANYSVTGNRMKPAIRIRKSSIDFLAVAGELISSTALSRNGLYTLALIYDHPSTTFKFVIAESGEDAFLAASGAANATFTGSARALGTANLGQEWTGDIQAFGMINRAITYGTSTDELDQIARGVEIESVITSGADRTYLIVLDGTGAVTPVWGSGSTTAVGDWTNRPAPSAFLPTVGTTYIHCNEHPVYKVCATDFTTNVGTLTCSGTYNGFTPSGIEARVIKYDGTVVVGWTTLSSQSVGSGAWSGSLPSIPHGDGYTLQIRDGVDNSKTWVGAHPFVVAPVAGTMGQSPHAIMEITYKNVHTLTGVGYVSTYMSNESQVVLIKATNVGAGYCETINQFYNAATNRPLYLVPCSLTGTSSTEWATDAINGVAPLGCWTTFKNSIDRAGITKITLFWLNGAADAGFTSATIKANHDTIYGLLETDIEGTRGIAFRYVMNPHNRNTSTNTAGDANMQKVRKAQYEWCVDHADFGTKVLLGVPYHDIQLDSELTGTASAYTTTTLTLATNDAATFSSGISAVVLATDSNGTQTRTGTAYNATTKVLTVSVAFSPALTGTVTYVVSWNTPHQDHFGAIRMGCRFGQMIAYLYGLSAVNPQGPIISSVTYPVGGDGSIFDVHFTHVSGAAIRTKAGGLTPSTIYGFEVSENSFSTLRTITSAAVVAADVVRLTMSGAASVLASTQVRYMNGAPVSFANFQQLDNTLYDDNGIGEQGGSPVQPTFDSLGVSADATSSYDRSLSDTISLSETLAKTKSSLLANPESITLAETLDYSKVSAGASSSITQYGITITFDDDYTTGQYTNGDYYVVGATVGITSITVADGARIAGSTVGIDGAMINPVVGTQQGFDNRHSSYVAGLNETLSYPIAMVAGDRLVATESFTSPFAVTATKTLYINTAIVLTCVASAPAAGSFRPPYSGPNDTTWNFSQIDKGARLLNLTVPASAPSLATAERYVQRCHLNTINAWDGYKLIPYLNSNYYGREISTDYGNALLMLICNEATIGNKDTLIKYVVQTGIDLYGMMRAGRNYDPNGGWMQGRAGILLMAGHLLQDDDMMAYGGSTLFSENGQTFYVTASDVSRPLKVKLTGTAVAATSSTLTLAADVPNTNTYALGLLTMDVTDAGGTQEVVIGSYNQSTRVCSGITWPDHTPSGVITYSIRGYEAEHLGMAEWGIVHVTDPTKDNPSLVATYRTVNYPYWYGSALACAAVGLQDTWDHPAFWDYLDRMDESTADVTFHRDMAVAHWPTYYTPPPAPAPSLILRAVPVGG